MTVRILVGDAMQELGKLPAPRQPEPEAAMRSVAPSCVKVFFG